MWFVCFCYLTDAWRKAVKPIDDYGKSGVQAAIVFSFFSIIVYVRVWFASILAQLFQIQLKVLPNHVTVTVDTVQHNWCSIDTKLYFWTGIQAILYINEIWAVLCSSVRNYFKLALTCMSMCRQWSHHWPLCAIKQEYRRRSWHAPSLTLTMYPPIQELPHHHQVATLALVAATLRRDLLVLLGRALQLTSSTWT